MRMASERLFLLTTLLLGVPAAALGQDSATRPHQAVYVELLGSGWLYTLNYERILQDRITVRLGGAVMSTEGLKYGLALAGMGILIGDRKSVV